MHSFKDRDERAWNVELNVAQVRRVRDALGVNLLDVGNGDMLADLAADPIALCDVLWVLCQQQAEAADITDEQFGRALVGDAIAEATDALLEELVDFFPSPRREVLRRVLSKVKEVDKRLQVRTEQLLEGGKLEQLMLGAIDEQEAKIDAELARLNAGSGTLPESSG